jgi:uncharacterized DUF497 family protein
MEFEWDEAKRAANLAKHGVDFALVVRVFEGETVEILDTSADYGEARIRCYGQIEGAVYFVTYT